MPTLRTPQARDRSKTPCHTPAANAEEPAGGIEGMRARFKVLTEDDLCCFAGRCDTAEAYAERLVDPNSPAADQARRILGARWRRWEALGVRGRDAASEDPLPHAPPLVRHIAAAIGATTMAWTGVQGAPWGREMIFSPEGYVLTTPGGGIYLDATVIRQKGEIWLSQMSVERRGEGLGTRTMEAIRAFATEQGLGVAVMMVTNRRFFGEFDWLRPKSDGFEYRAEAAELAAYAQRQATGAPDPDRWTVHVTQDGAVVATLYGATMQAWEKWWVQPGQDSGVAEKHFPVCATLQAAAAAAVREFGAAGAPHGLVLADGPERPDLGAAVAAPDVRR